MGLGFALVLGGTFACLFAALCSFLLRTAVSFFLRGEAEPATPLLRTATLLPFLCLLWAGVVFVALGLVNETFLQRDFGLGDSPTTPIADGYNLTFGDLADYGELSGSKPGSHIDGVRDLQIAGPYILGAADSQWLKHYEQPGKVVDSYFLLDTRNSGRCDFRSDAELQREASALGVRVALQPAYDIYRGFRFTAFDCGAGVLVIFPPITGLGYLASRVLVLRRERRTHAS